MIDDEKPAPTINRARDTSMAKMDFTTDRCICHLTISKKDRKTDSELLWIVVEGLLAEEVNMLRWMVFVEWMLSAVIAATYCIPSFPTSHAGPLSP
jgi:hypothetical protein